MMLHVFEDYKEGFLAEGREESRKETAASLLQEGMSDDDVHRHTKLSLEEIAELKDKLRNGT